MSLPLSRCAALVTGGGSGIGLACARWMAARGASVTITGRSAERLEVARGEITALAAADAGIQAVPGDVANEDDVADAVAAAAEPLGGLHLAVASAGTGTMSPVIATDLDEWHRVMEVNLTGGFLTLKHAGAAMVATGEGGAMVTISSIASPLSHAFMGPYCAAKAGLDALVGVTADELGRHGIRVNSIQPGLVRTELGDHLINDPQVLEDYLAQMPVSRVGSPDDVAAAVGYLVSPEAGWVTGQRIAVDGGHTLRRGPDLEHWARGFFGDEAVDGPSSGGTGP